MLLTKKELEVLPTPRLLAYFKSKRAVINWAQAGENFYQKEWKEHYESQCQGEWMEEVLGKRYEDELVEDMLTLMSSFSNKIYSKRSAENRKKKKLDKLAAMGQIPLGAAAPVEIEEVGNTL